MAAHDSRTRKLTRLAGTVLQPGFGGTEAPGWVRRAVAEGLGGVALFARNIVSVEQVIELNASLRVENPELIVAIDEEAGDVTRIEARTGSTRPGNLALGMVDDVALTEAIARDLGLELAAAGFSLNYAPSADVNSNPLNPVIGVRSFGADQDLVSRHTVAWVRGLQSAGVAACAKHFPGHGDTAVDSHLGLPQLDAPLEIVTAVELPPFHAAIAAGVQAIMTAHLMVPCYDPELPATLSPRILTGLLREELGFDGVVITDAIEMAAVSKRYGLAGAAVRAVAAGADAVCVGGENYDEETYLELRGALVDAVLDGSLSEERLADAATRVARLAAQPGKQSAGDGARTAGLGLDAARRALRIEISREGVLPLRSPAHVVELVPQLTLAIDRRTPWGVASPLHDLMPGTTSVRLTEEQLARGRDPLATALAAAQDRPLVVVVRDAHRLAWIAAAVSRLLQTRPDTIVVEMGMPGHLSGEAAYIVTQGATRVAGQAAAELLAGVEQPAWVMG